MGTVLPFPVEMKRYEHSIACDILILYLNMRQRMGEMPDPFKVQEPRTTWEYMKFEGNRSGTLGNNRLRDGMRNHPPPGQPGDGHDGYDGVPSCGGQMHETQAQV